jgi:hypothetical protein
MHPGLIRLALAAILPAIALGGCATVAPVNARGDRVRAEAGYRIAKFMVRDRGPANNPDALVLLAFSGGGTRAAALSYGVLEELRRTPIMVKGHQHSLLDEVDLIAGVSGGSFTALAYALYGERLFHEYQQRFLKRDVQGELIRRILVPIDHFSFESVELLRDIAARWADRRELAIARRLDAGQSRTEAEAAVPRITFDAIDVSFDAIEDPSERREFLEMPTTFFLPPESIDRLRELGGRLLRNSHPYKILLQRIGELAKRDTPSPVQPPAR